MTIIDNKTYSWKTGTITFLDNGKIREYNDSKYKQKEEFIFKVKINGEVFFLSFNKRYRKFSAVKKDNTETFTGKIIENQLAVVPNIIPHQNTNPEPNPNVAFVTLTNSGYIDYTLNCLQSLKRINCSLPLHSFCIGENGHDTLKKNGYYSSLIQDTNVNNTQFQTFKNNGWADITFQKFNIIYQNLLTHKFVLFTDGDIVYENNEFINFLLQNIKKKDMLIQNESQTNDGNYLCTGFMFIQSNDKTISLFNPINVNKNKQMIGSNWEDQTYINDFKHTLKYKTLPLELFPNGKYYYDNCHRITPYMIHFNWVVGHTKKEKMIHYEKWYL
jgi:hypothetical protein